MVGLVILESVVFEVGEADDGHGEAISVFDSITLD
jgi:hypothetical protein